MGAGALRPFPTRAITAQAGAEARNSLPRCQSQSGKVFRANFTVLKGFRRNFSHRKEHQEREGHGRTSFSSLFLELCVLRALRGESHYKTLKIEKTPPARILSRNGPCIAFDSPHMKPVTMRRTRLLATLGPASDSDKIIKALIEAGADCFRINMSHAKHDVARDTVRRIRRIAVNCENPVGVLFDLTGPSIRTGTLDEAYQLKKDDRVEFRIEEAKATLPISTTVNYAGLLKDVKVGNKLIVDNGTLLMEIESIADDHLVAVNHTPGELGSRRHINLPGTRLNLPALTEKDRKDLDLAVECQADFVAGSFVRDADHVRELKAEIKRLGGHAQVISKLEDQEAMRNLDSIIEASDVIMVARGDLGIEVHIEELPILQRKIVKRCQEKGKRVIVATHMLESMISNPTPTRAEVTDVANAVFEEADVLMVSGETSVGKYPVEPVLKSSIESRAVSSARVAWALLKNQTCKPTSKRPSALPSSSQTPSRTP